MASGKWQIANEQISDQGPAGDPQERPTGIGERTLATLISPASGGSQLTIDYSLVLAKPGYCCCQCLVQGAEMDAQFPLGSATVIPPVAGHQASLGLIHSW